MIQIEAKQELAKLGFLLRDIPDTAVTSAFFNSVNRALTTGRKEASQQFTAIYKLKSSEVKDRLISLQARRSRNINDMNAALVISNRPVPLILYKARQTKAGVKVNIKGGAQLVKGAFMATMKSGHVGVFMRNENRPQRRKWVKDPSKPKGGYSTALPIVERFGISPFQFFKAEGNVPRLESAITTSFESNFASDLPFYIQRSIERAGLK
jgi:hypothetical protein